MNTLLRLAITCFGLVFLLLFTMGNKSGVLVPVQDQQQIPLLVTPFPGAPACTDHDKTKFHTLWNAELGCHYDHSHGADPNSVADIFGPLSLDQGISYPWQTFAGANANYPPPPSDSSLLENNAKHAGYHWIVGRDLPCAPNATMCIKAFRTEMHILPHKQDAVVRFHSFYAEVLVCYGVDLSTCGIVRGGGWQEFPGLSIDAVSYPLPGEISPNGASGRQHFWQGGTFKSSANRSATWYGAGAIISVSFRFETLTALEPDANLDEHYFCDGYATPDGNPAACPPPYNRQNGSFYVQHIIALHLKDNLDGIVDGIVNIPNGYTDRYGKIVTNCTAVGLDCVPLSVDHLPPNLDLQNYRGSGQGERSIEMDMAPVGEYWLHYPQH